MKTSATGREVTKDVFWKYIMALTINVHPRCVGPWPYDSIFETQDGIRREVGRIVCTHVSGTYPDKEQYFLAA